MPALLIVLTLGLLVVPPGEAQDAGPFFTFAAVQVDPPEPLPPGGVVKLSGTVKAGCMFGSLQIDPGQLDGVEVHTLAVNTTTPNLVATIHPSTQLIHWGATDCVEGATREYRFSITLAAQPDTPAWQRSNVSLTVDPEWGTPATVEHQTLVRFGGSIGVEAPDEVELHGGASQLVPIVFTNDANGPAVVDADPILRGLRGPQPDLPSFELAAGETRVVHVPVTTDEAGPAQGVLDLRFDAYSADDRASKAEIHPLRVPLRVGGLEPNTHSAEEATMPGSTAAFLLFVAMAGTMRRWRS